MNWPGGQALNANAAQAGQLSGAAARDPQQNPGVEGGWLCIWLHREVGVR